MATASPLPVPDFKSRVFLFGADMNPTIILRRWPGSRFIGIASADGMLTRVIGRGANAFGPDVWGIVIETGSAQRGMAVPLTLRDGASATAMLAGDPAAAGSPAEILVEADYWELPDAYREYLRAAVRQGA